MSQFIVQNALLIIIAVIAAVSLAMPLINTRRFGPMVSSEQAVSLINKQNALVVDVRAQKDYKRVRIANSVNIPANEIQNRLGELSKDRTIIVVDNSGNMSAAASKLLRGVGFTKVYVLDSGLVGWMRDKLPLES
ncbi:rhodanese-like domain-containing protein [Sutterella wadsworthensis]|jgi:rhodanese domain protein|uniref:rhodanese-like domain-containing protein n=1 Tax=Sutterella wadsworthensis TaxID=40545 RepID=UPI001D06E9AE|nr:rhodanese-like domain-containing protein [Sutterella wadsworthensis]MCB7455783.1 rhodanese-like domain-containing protein [Sutterella wadsworthensis]